jgi:uncharacterized membrane protein HdeD (DUF308 family)
MLSSVTRNWWVPALRGALAVAFGVAAFAWPGITFEVLVLLFGAYAFVDGLLLLTFAGLAAGAHQRWWPLVLGGILGLATGALTFAQPQTTALALVYVVGTWAIVIGVLTIVAAIRLRQVISNEWLLGFSGALQIIFGALVVAQPGAGALTLVFLIGFYAILLGLAQISLGVRLRTLGRSPAPQTQSAPAPSR